MDKGIVDAKKLIFITGISFFERIDLLVPLSFLLIFLGIFKKTKLTLCLEDF